MWIIGVMREKTRSNANLSVREDAFITKTSLKIISDFVNWIRVMQAFGEESLCMLMYTNVTVKTRPNNFCVLLTSVQRSAEVRALQGMLSFCLYFYLSGYVCSLWSMLH